MTRRADRPEHDTSTDDPVHPSDYTRFQIEQLAALANLEASETVASGAAIQRQLEAYLDTEISQPRLYQNLDDLAEAGLLTRTQHDGRTYELELTAAGRACLRERVEWLADQAGLTVIDVDPGGADPDGGSAVLQSDGGFSDPGGRIDPLVCPRGHHAISISANRFSCNTCRQNGFDVTAWDQSDLVDLRDEEPPLAEEDLATDGGSESTADALQSCSRIEAERHARQAARSLDSWSRAARLDPLTLIQEETPVVIGCGRDDQRSADRRTDHGRKR